MLRRSICTLGSLALAAAAAAQPRLDLFLVQDLSYSFANDLNVLETKLPELLDSIKEDYPGSRFGLGSFVDKPVEPFGYSISEDYCYRLHYSLRDLKDIADLPSVLSSLETYSGNDWEENQLEALLHAVRAVETGWKFEEDRVPILIVSTDAGFHRAGDGMSKAQSVSWTGNSGGYDVDCLGEDYPSVSQVAQAINEKDVKVIFLVSPDLVPYYEKVKDDMGVDGVVMDLQTDSSNIISAVRSALDHLKATALLEHAPLKNAHGFGETAARTIRSRLASEAGQLAAEHELNSTGFTDEERQQLEANARKWKSVRKVVRDPQSVQSVPKVTLDDNGRRMLNCPVVAKKDIRFEVVLAQDASDSFGDDLPNIQKNVPEVFRFIQEQYPDSRFGLTAFVDKPTAPFGYAEAGDYCASMRVGLTAQIDKIQRSVDTLVVRSGRDWKEAQLHALMHSAYTKKAGWNFDNDYYQTFRIVVVSTDAGYHKAGESDLPPNNGDRSQDCEGEDYPSIEQVRDALIYFNIYPVFMVTEPVKTIYEDLLNHLNLPGVVVEIDDKSEKFEEALISALNNVCHAYFPSKPVSLEDHACCVQDTGCGCGGCGGGEGVNIYLAQKPKFMKLIVEN
ncbi:MAG: uncharacterized protein KVP18_001334 [Porospora cf. gigantea A]|uniref:uncharacterized protein n=1 Tax=Porospora cf. gigantea A TaxID=2853593 RepID=UPI00355970C1|nr:MAG: hypothetical protein KVP18_001334 [Porospora cf. gigantea A]